MNPGSSLLATLIPLPALLPLLGAGLTLVLSRRPMLQRAVSVAVLAVVVVIAALLLVAAVQSGPVVVTVGSWPVPLGITLVVDPLSALMLLTSMTVTLAVLVYAIGQGVYDRDEDTPITIFHPTYLVLAAGVANAFLSGDLFNLYVGFEVLLMASYVLLTLGGSRSRVRAGITYVVVNVVSSLVFLVGIALVYAAVGTLNLAQISLADGRGAAGHGAGDPPRAAHGVRHQGRRVPAVGVAARQLPDRGRPGHRGVRRPAHQGRRVLDHPDRDAAVPGLRGHPDRPARRRGADHARRGARCDRAGRHQADPVVHPRQPHRLHDLRDRARDPARRGRRRVLRRPPHHRAGHAVLRGRPHRGRRRLDVGDTSRRAGEGVAAARRCSGSSPRSTWAASRRCPASSASSGWCRPVSSTAPRWPGRSWWSRCSRAC